MQMAASQRDAARANARLAEDTFGRYQKLFEARSVTPQELDEVRARRDAAAAELAARETAVAAATSRIGQIEARIAQANAGLQRAEVVVGWTVIKAPAGGRVVERPVDPGQRDFPGKPAPRAGIATDSAGCRRNPDPVRPAVLKSGLEVQVIADSEARRQRPGHRDRAPVQPRQPHASGSRWTCRRIPPPVPAASPGS